jgi:hypothetical protein
LQQVYREWRSQSFFVGGDEPAFASKWYFTNIVDIMTSPTECTLIHISDLHLRFPLTAAGRKLKSRLGTRTHSFHFIQAAAEAIRRIRLSFPEAFLVASGDLTTLGDPTSFYMSRQLIEAREVMWEQISHDVGFEFLKDYFVVPGNHDRYDDYPWEFQYTRFEDEFQRQLPTDNFKEYGIVIHDAWERHNRRMPQVRLLKNPSEQVYVLIIGLNSTGPGRIPNVLQQIAQGFVPVEELEYVRKVMNDVDRGRVMLSSGERISFSGGRVFAIVVLHHHPYLPPDVDASFFTQLINAEDVVSCCREAGVRMLLYGHQHLAFVDPVTLGTKTLQPSSMIFGASGSLSVHGEPSNSFNVYHIGPERIEYEIWQFEKGLFRPSSRVGHFSW